MDSENECSILECVEDNEGIVNLFAAENMENIGQHNIWNNGFCVVETNDCEESFSEIAGKKTEGSGTSNLPPVEIVPGLSPSSTMTRKWNGLKKWRRIKRDSNKVGDGSVDMGNVVALDMSDSGLNRSKRMQISSERKQKSQGSVSSTNATVRSLDDFALLGHSGTDMENGEIWGSKSSTEASSPKMRSETSSVVEFSPDEIGVRSFRWKKFTESTPRGQQGKSRIVASKKSRGEKVNIEKENSHSSVESDVRSSNFVFMQGMYPPSNGIQSERSTDDDGENGNEVQGIQQRVNNGLQDGEARYEDISPEHVSDDSSREVKEGGSQNYGSSIDLDPLAESILNLESVKEAMEKEVLMFREMRQDDLLTDPVWDSSAEFANVDQNPQETSSDPSQSGEGGQRFSVGPRSMVLETENRDVETKIEDLFVQKIEAEVEYLALSGTVQNLRVSVLDQITILEEQKTLASKQTQILNKLGDTEKKAVILNKEAEKLEKFCEDIASADETLKLQNRVCKYTTYFFMQLVTLVLVLGILVFQLSPKYVGDIPT